MRGRIRGALGFLTGAIIGLLLTSDASALEVGQKAPDFTLMAQDGRPVKLGDLLGKGPVVIFTFIEAFTRG
jgi:thioredoxin-dependent peroxiredoxin